MNWNIIKWFVKQEDKPVDFEMSMRSMQDALHIASESLYDDYEIFETVIQFFGLRKRIWIIAYYA